MAAFDPNNPYLRQQVLTAPPEKLRLILLEGCVRFMRDGRDALVAKRWEDVFKNFTSAKDIVLELINSMKPDVAPELCAQVASVLTFVYNHLTEASFEKNVAKVDECIRLMEYERETWALLIDRLASERSGPQNARTTPTTLAGSDSRAAKPLSLSA